MVEAHRHVVIECAKFPSWECSSKLWHKDIGQYAYEGVQRNVIDELIQSDTTKEKQDVIILSFPQYCRYKTCLEMLKMGLQMSSLKTLLARGGLKPEYINAIILFGRWQFRKCNIEDYTLTVNVPGL